MAIRAPDGANKGLLYLYILKKINGDVDRPTDQPTDRQGEYGAICLFRKLENKKKAEICNKVNAFICHSDCGGVKRAYPISKYLCCFFLCGARENVASIVKRNI